MFWTSSRCLYGGTGGSNSDRRSPLKKSMNTVFVVGAGASAEAKLPTGLDLKRIIAQLLDLRYNRIKAELVGMPPQRIPLPMLELKIV